MAYNPDDWKPGDIAEVTHQDGSVEVCRRGYGNALFTLKENLCWLDTSVVDARRLVIADPRKVVILDPNNTEQIERLIDLGFKTSGPTSRRWFVGRMVEVLRSMLEPTPPPVPEEPTDLAARVIDRHGAEWARLRDGKWASDILTMHSWGTLVADRGPVEVILP